MIALLLERGVDYSDAEADALVAEATKRAQASGRSVRSEAEGLLDGGHSRVGPPQARPTSPVADGRLDGAEFVAFIAVGDLSAALRFYEGTLGVRVVETDPFAVVLTTGGTTVRLTQVDGHRPLPHTVAGWVVVDIAATVDALGSRGVSFVRYGGMDQDERGIWSAPGGVRVAWFRDPDGNTLSLTEHPPTQSASPIHTQ